MDSVFFWLSKLIWLIVAPDSLLLILVVLTWLLLWRGGIKWARGMLSAIAAAMLFIGLFPVGEWLLYPLESRFAANPELPKKVDGIIVLGGAADGTRSAAWGQVEVGSAAERYLASLDLSRRYPDARLVFTGGSGSMLYQAEKEAVVAKALYQQQGLDTSKITFEDESRNTAENASFSKSLLKPAPGENWVLVTSAFHMPRSVGIFCKTGWPVIPYPVDHFTVPGRLLRIDLDLAGHLSDLNVGIREWIGLTAYYLTGRTPTLLPEACRA